MNQIWDDSNIDKEKQLLSQPHFVVLDIETTGLSPAKGGRIIEIAAVRVINGEPQDTFHSMVNPQLKIPPKVTQITGIANEDVVNQPTTFQVLPELYEFLGNAIIVAHNIAFDWNRFLLNSFEQVGLFPKNETFCTMRFFKKIAPNRGRGSYRLDKMCELLNVPLNNHHRAMDDTMATTKCLLKFVEMFGSERTTTQSYVATKKEKPHTPIQIKQVRYWEKRKNKREMYRRQYVRLVGSNEYGSVYFDIPTKTWGNKDFPLPLDFEKVEQEVMSFLGIDDRQEFIYFRNS